MTVSATRVGRVAAGLNDVTITPRYVLERPPFLYCHSASGTPVEAVGFTELGAIGNIVRRIVDYGFSCCAAGYDHSFGTGGTDASAGYTHSGRVQEAIDHHRTTLRGTNDPVVLFGCSMGAANALIYALAHPENVACLVGVIPAIDLVDIYQNDIDGLRSYVEAGWEITHPTSLPAMADLVTRASELDIPARFYYANNDAVTSSAAVTAYNNAGAEMIDIGALDHTGAAINAVPVDDVAEFIQLNVAS